MDKRMSLHARHIETGYSIIVKRQDTENHSKKNKVMTKCLVEIMEFLF